VSFLVRIKPGDRLILGGMDTHWTPFGLHASSWSVLLSGIRSLNSALHS